MKILAVKEWLANKNNMIDNTVYAVMEVREKAVNIAVVLGAKIQTVWTPKSCLEFMDAKNINADLYAQVKDDATIDEAIEANITALTFAELAAKNRSMYNMYR